MPMQARRNRKELVYAPDGGERRLYSSSSGDEAAALYGDSLAHPHFLLIKYAIKINILACFKRTKSIYYLTLFEDIWLMV